MKQALPRILLAATASGSGKTTITCGLLQVLINRGIICSAWKCGPDYIDPMFHNYVLGIKGGNLDSYFLSEEELKKLFAQSSAKSSMAVIEGVMGYYDGVAGISTQASSYDIARITETPVILVLDCKGASLSVAAVTQGFLNYRSHSRIQGVLLNRCSSVMAERLKPVIEQLGVSVVGWIPDSRWMQLESRHLGLVIPEEVHQLKQKLDEMAIQFCKTVNVDKILEIAQSAPDIEREELSPATRGAHVKIAVARGKAFCFYYQENLRLLESLGAELIEFDPLKDSSLPSDIGGMILGGGYPELYAKILSSNTQMLGAVSQAVADGLPYLAECGGFLYLHEELEDAQGELFSMAGVIEGKAYRTEKLSRFGYLSLTPHQAKSCLKGDIKGHEFHYWDSENPGSDWQARKPLNNKNWDCVHDKGYQIAGFPHLYYPSGPEFLEDWMEGCRIYEKRQKGKL